MTEQYPTTGFWDLTGKKAAVIGASSVAGQAVVEAYGEAGAQISTAASVEEATKELGGLDIVAVVTDTFLAKPVTATSDDDLQSVMDANFLPHFQAIRAAADEFQRAEQPGRIVCITSVLGERGLPNATAYAAAHGAVQNLIRAAALELGPRNICINGIALGWMEWMDDRIAPDDDEAQRAIRFTLLKRKGKAEEVGPLAVYLSSEVATRYVSGQIFPVDGGLLQHL